MGVKPRAGDLSGAQPAGLIGGTSRQWAPIHLGANTVEIE